MKKKMNRQIWICSVLILLNLSFIWGNSLLPGSDSSEISNRLLLWIVDTLGAWIPGGEFGLRKLAHFSEFACLGLLLTWLFTILDQKSFHRFTLPLLCGSMAALMDETIQVLVPERGPSVIDVWIDTAGVTTGILFLLLAYRLCRRRTQSPIGGN